MLIKCGSTVIVLLGRSVQATLGGVLQKFSQQLNFMMKEIIKRVMTLVVVSVEFLLVEIKVDLVKKSGLHD